MLGLIPDLTQNQIDKFLQHGTKLYFGHLLFTEEATPELVRRYGHVKAHGGVISKNFLYTWIRPYPDENIARSVRRQFSSPFSIDLSEFNRE